MPQSDYAVTVDIVRSGKSKDGQGGKVEVWPPSGGVTVASALTAFRHRRSVTAYTSVETGGRAIGPGQMSLMTTFFEFRNPLPATVKVGDRIVTADGETWRVALPERRYAGNLQIDCERVV